jgi:hypothetical protein
MLQVQTNTMNDDSSLHLQSYQSQQPNVLTVHCIFTTFRSMMTIETIYTSNLVVLMGAAVTITMTSLDVCTHRRYITIHPSMK